VSWDPYLDLEHGVLRNRLGLTDPGELARAEADLVATRIVDLQRTDLPGGYDLDHLQEFHEHLFGDVYDWAGELRTVAIGKGVAFCHPADLRVEGLRGLRPVGGRRHLRGLDRAAFVDGLTVLFAQLNALHPFREGNGRTLRAFLAQLARAAGPPAALGRVDGRGEPGRLPRRARRRLPAAASPARPARGGPARRPGADRVIVTSRSPAIPVVVEPRRQPPRRSCGSPSW
jgi:cell filamentation protein